LCQPKSELEIFYIFALYLPSTSAYNLGTQPKADFFDTTVSLPCLVMLQRVSRSYKGHQISEKFDTNEEVK
jgi:hypothetical protein